MQTERTGGSRAPPAFSSFQLRTQALVCAQKCCIGHIQHIPPFRLSYPGWTRAYLQFPFERKVLTTLAHLGNVSTQEGDASCKRNAFIMLFNCAQDRAIEYLGSVLDQVSTFGDMLQFIVVELIRKVCRTNPSERVCS